MGCVKRKRGRRAEGAGLRSLDCQQDRAGGFPRRLASFHLASRRLIPLCSLHSLAAIRVILQSLVRSLDSPEYGRPIKS